MFQKIFQVIIQIIYGFAENSFSLHPTIFEKGSLTLCSKRFSKLSTKLFMGFIFKSREKGVFFQKKRGLKNIIINFY